MTHHCIACNYKTKYRSNFHTHKKTNKHMKNLERCNAQRRIARLKIKNQKLCKKYICGKCNKDFKRSFNLNRHQGSGCIHSISKSESSDESANSDNDEMYDSDSTIESIGSDSAHPNIDTPEVPSDTILVQRNEPNTISRELNKDLKIDDSVYNILKVYNLKDLYYKDKCTICPFCKATFSRRSSRERHLKCCVKLTILRTEYNLNVLSERKVSCAEKKSTDMEREKNIYKDHVDKLSTTIVSKSNGGSLGKITNISNKYPNAEPLQLMDYKKYLKNTNIVYNKKKPYKDFEGQFLEEVICANIHSDSSIILSQAIINMYKNESDPDKQSIWCMDSSRLKYAVMKEEIDGCEWIFDDGCTHINKMIIDPLMKSLDVLLKNYKNGRYLEDYEKYLIKKYPRSKSKQKPDMLYIEQHIRYQLEATKLRDQIARGTLQRKILKYLTDYFTFVDRKKIKDKAIRRKKNI